jgi:hypothetical protein
VHLLVLRTVEWEALKVIWKGGRSASIETYDADLYTKIMMQALIELVHLLRPMMQICTQRS